MCEYSELEPLIVTSHAKGLKRGISIYFGINELNQLENHGIYLKNNRRFLARVTTDNKIILIPFSNLEFLLDIEDKLDQIIDLNKEDKDDFAEELLTIISDNKTEIGNRERYSILQFAKGHYTKYNLRNAIQVGFRIDKGVTQDLINRYIENREV